MRFEPTRYHARTASADLLLGEGTRRDVALIPAPPASSCRSAAASIAAAMAGLTELATSLSGPLGATFERAVTLIVEATGRVVVTGMGKSGHIGAKIAATLASTGTPAFFVHPAEASHGDLGMITPGDVVLALSWSGETVELKNLVLHSRRFRIPLIAITSRAPSTLAHAADLALIVPRVADACAGGLAPTTSTLIQLAVGDALATALLERGGFTADDFHRFHPGGLLGANLTRVRDVMHTGDRLPLTSIGTMMGEALLVMTRQRFGCLGVTDMCGHLVGIVTDGDLRRHLGPGIFERPVEDVMTCEPKVIQPDMLVASALETLNRNVITVAFVVEDDAPVGIVHLHDLLRIGAQ